MHTQLYSDLESRIKSELLSTACKALFDLTSGTTVYRQAAILDSLYLFIFNSYSKNIFSFLGLQNPPPSLPTEIALVLQPQLKGPLTPTYPPSPSSL